MDNQIKEIASIINNYNKKTEIKINGYSASHLPISYEECILSAHNIKQPLNFIKMVPNLDLWMLTKHLLIYEK